MMHRALTCYDIIVEIMGYLPRSTPVYKIRMQPRYSSLAICAQICKAFSKPALDRLWQEMEDLYPLFRLLPGLRQNFVTKQYLLSGWICPSDLERFHFYARRVRTLRYFHSHANIDKASFFLLVQMNGKRCLLPELRSLEWGQFSCSDIDIFWLAPPSLRRLKFNLTRFNRADTAHAQVVTDEMQREVDELLPSLFVRLPYLEELELRGYNFSLSKPPLVHVERLRSLDVTAVRVLALRDLLHFLFKVESLTRLSVSVIIPSTGQETNLCNPTGDSFLALRHLKARGSFLHMSQLLAATSYPAMECLQVDITDGDDFQHFGTFLSTLQLKAETLSNTLCGVHLGFGFKSKPIATVPSFMDFIRPILPLRNVRVVTLAFAYPHLNIAAEDAGTMAQAWPRLEQLKIFGDFDKGVSLPAIVDMAERCPDLHMLALPIYFDEAHLSALQARSGIVSRTLVDFERKWEESFDWEQSQRFRELFARFFPRINFRRDTGLYLQSKGQWHLLPPLDLCVADARSKRLRDVGGIAPGGTDLTLTGPFYW